MNSVFDGLRAEFRLIAEAKTGVRFVEHHERHRKKGIVSRAIAMALGCALIVAGILMVVLPGPGFIAILVGMGFIGGELRIVARLLDWIESTFVQLKHRRWDPMSRPVRHGIVMLTMVWCGLMAVVTTAYTFGFADQLPLLPG